MSSSSFLTQRPSDCAVCGGTIAATRAQKDLPWYGKSDQPESVQHALHTATLPGLDLSPVNPFTQYAPILRRYLRKPSPGSFPSNRALEYFLLTDTPGSTSPTVNVMVQKSLSTKNKCTGRALHNISLSSASFPSVLLLPLSRFFAEGNA
jgi:hypothetical protein